MRAREESGEWSEAENCFLRAGNYTVARLALSARNVGSCYAQNIRGGISSEASATKLPWHVLQFATRLLASTANIVALLCALRVFPTGCWARG
jgi:hypothetical protein